MLPRKGPQSTHTWELTSNGQKTSPKKTPRNSDKSRDYVVSGDIYPISLSRNIVILFYFFRGEVPQNPRPGLSYDTTLPLPWFSLSHTLIRELLLDWGYTGRAEDMRNVGEENIRVSVYRLCVSTVFLFTLAHISAPQKISVSLKMNDCYKGC